MDHCRHTSAKSNSTHLRQGLSRKENFLLSMSLTKKLAHSLSFDFGTLFHTRYRHLLSLNTLAPCERHRIGPTTSDELQNFPWFSFHIYLVEQTLLNSTRVEARDWVPPVLLRDLHLDPGFLTSTTKNFVLNECGLELEFVKERL